MEIQGCEDVVVDVFLYEKAKIQTDEQSEEREPEL